MINEVVELVNLGTRQTQEVRITSYEAGIQAIESFNPNGNSLDMEYREGVLTGDATQNVLNLVALAEKYKASLEMIGHIYNTALELETVEQILEEGTWVTTWASNKFEAFREHLEATGVLAEVPSFVMDYIDFEAYYQDSPITITRISKEVNHQGYYQYLILT